MKDIKIVGMAFDEFEKALERAEDRKFEIKEGRVARLIPYEKNVERAMTSVFLSTLSLVKEFREIISEKMDLSKRGSLYCYTEVSFPVDCYKKGSRFDGLALVVSGNIIKDACIFEMKADSEIESGQIEEYVDMATHLGIQKIVSVSNQFVTSPTDYPVSVTLPKKWKGKLYHFSWSYIIYWSEILLKKNGTDIDDIDQQNIMTEFLKYFNELKKHKIVKDFDSMKTAAKSSTNWNEVIIDLADSNNPTSRRYKEDRREIVKSWIQEEKDLSLKLSNRLSSKKATEIKIKTKYKKSLDRIEEEVRQLEKVRKLTSVFNITDAVSPLEITVDFKRKVISASMLVNVPTDKTAKGKIGFIRKYIKKAKEKNFDEKFETIQENCIISPKIKSKTKNIEIEKYTIKKFLDDDIDIPKNEFDAINVMMEHHFELDISRTKFIKNLEDTVLDYYSVLMQYFEKWTPQTPKAESNDSEKMKKDFLKEEE